MNDVISVAQTSSLKYNVITSIAPDLSSVGIGSTTSVLNVFDGTSISNGNYTANLRVAEIKNSENGFLYANLPESNISSVDLSGSQLLITNQITAKSTDSYWGFQYPWIYLMLVLQVHFTNHLIRKDIPFIILGGELEQ